MLIIKGTTSTSSIHKLYARYPYRFLVLPLCCSDKTIGTTKPGNLGYLWEDYQAWESRVLVQSAEISQNFVIFVGTK